LSRDYAWAYLEKKQNSYNERKACLVFIPASPHYHSARAIMAQNGLKEDIHVSTKVFFSLSHPTFLPILLDSFNEIIAL